MKTAPIKIFILLLAVVSVIIFPIFLNSCQLRDKLFNYNKSSALEISAANTTSSQSSAKSGKLSQSENGAENVEASEKEREAMLIFFDYKKIKLDITTSIGVKIKNCNLLLDYFGNLNVLGEIENRSNSNKTGITVTFEFYDKDDEIIFKDELPAPVNYLGVSSKLPFSYTVRETQKYIDISRIKIGVNYKDYFQITGGNAIARKEEFYYKEDILHIGGKVINIGENKIVNLILLAPFYDNKDRVVFIKKCFLPSEELESQQQQDFSLDVLLNKYTPFFTHYDFEVFFEDSVNMP